MKKSNMARLYNKIAEAYTQDFAGPSEHLDAFSARLPKQAAVLDAGCGIGTDAGTLSRQGFQVTGVDMASRMLHYARQYYPEVDFRQADIRHINLPARSFHGIVSACALIHLPKKDIPAVLHNFNRMLKPRGMLYLNLQYGEPEEVHMPEPYAPDEMLFINVMGDAEIRKLLQDNGFKGILRFLREPAGTELHWNKLTVIAAKI